MKAYEWRAQFKSSGTARQLPDIQSVNIFRGRQRQIDDYAADRLTITCRNPSGWTYTPKLGDPIVVYVYRPGVVVGNTDFTGFIGNIRDVEINYGKLPAEDEVTISGEGILADWGRAQLNGLSLLQENIEDQLFDIETVTGLDVLPFGVRSTASAQTYTGNALDLANKLARTEEARMYAVNYLPTVDLFTPWKLYFRGRGSYVTGNTTFEFNDGTGTPGIYDIYYDQVEFRSSADNYYNQVTITPQSVAAQTATISETPLYSWQKDTLDFSTGQASDHANWLLNNFRAKNATVASISFLDVAQPDSLPFPFTTENPNLLTAIEFGISQQALIKFRGSTFNCVCEGVQITANPSQTRVTLYLSGEDTNAYLILDDTTFGRLDFNKLGY